MWSCAPDPVKELFATILLSNTMVWRSVHPEVHVLVLGDLVPRMVILGVMRALRDGAQ